MFSAVGRGKRCLGAAAGWTGPIAGGAVEEKAGGPFRLCGFEQTSARICPPFYAHNGRALAHAVGHFRAMVRLEGIERPIGIGHHANPSLGGDKNGHVRGSVAGLGQRFRQHPGSARRCLGIGSQFPYRGGGRCLKLFRALVL